MVRRLLSSSLGDNGQQDGNTGDKIVQDEMRQNKIICYEMLSTFIHSTDRSSLESSWKAPPKRLCWNKASRGDVTFGQAEGNGKAAPRGKENQSREWKL